MIRETIDQKIKLLRDEGVEIVKKNTKAILTLVSERLPLANTKMICPIISKIESNNG